MSWPVCLHKVDRSKTYLAVRLWLLTADFVANFGLGRVAAVLRDVGGHLLSDAGSLYMAVPAVMSSLQLPSSESTGEMTSQLTTEFVANYGSGPSCHYSAGRGELPAIQRGLALHGSIRCHVLTSTSLPCFGRGNARGQVSTPPLGHYLDSSTSRFVTAWWKGLVVSLMQMSYWLIT